MLGCFSVAFAAATALTGSVVVQVSDPVAAQTEVVAAAKGSGGWFTNLSDDAVTVRVPSKDARAWLTKAEGLGRVVDRSWASQSLDTQIETLEARLASRKDILEKYFQVLKDADPASFVLVQSSISQAISEIERIEGQLRLYRHQADYAALTVRFTFVDRAAPARDGSSSFAWLNTMNLADLQAEVQAGTLRHRSAGVSAVVPSGFAPFRKKSRFAATSPDDVFFRVRTVRNKPKADLPFWTEALRVRMEAAGYTIVEAGSFTTADGASASWLELGAADGPVDESYLIGLAVDGGRLVVFESAGPATEFLARRGALMDAMKAARL